MLSSWAAPAIATMLQPEVYMVRSRGARNAAAMLFALALVAGVRDAAAQVKVGVLIGVNSASLSIPEALIPVEDIDLTVSVGRRTGFIGGAFVDIPAGRSLVFEVGGLFSQKGSATSISIPGVVSGTADTRITYLDVPILGLATVAQFSKARIYLLGGPSIGFKLGARTKATVEGQSDSLDISDELPSTDIGLVFGGRAEFGQVLAEFRYTHGFTDLSDSEAESVKNRVYSVLIGWKFGSVR
jgi:hypothetical protein